MVNQYIHIQDTFNCSSDCSLVVTFNLLCIDTACLKELMITSKSAMLLQVHCQWYNCVLGVTE